MKFSKKCKSCGKLYEGARNQRLCVECGTYKPRVPRVRRSKWLFDGDQLKVDRELYSYSLGFMCADGSVGYSQGRTGSVRYVGAYSTDKELIESLSLRWKFDRPLFVADDSVGCKVTWGQLFGKEHAIWWVSQGLKSKDQLDLADFNIDLYPFLRGHLDGDGSIKSREVVAGVSLSVVRFLARERMAASIVWYLKEEGFEVSACQNDRLWAIDLACLEGMRFLKRMYAGATIFLKRKKDIFDQIVASGY